MIAGDFFVFVDSASKILDGVYKSLYPLPFVYFFIPFIENPIIGYLFISLVSICILIYYFKWKSLAWVFYAPFLQMIWGGQVDMIIFALINSGNPFLMALATLKPQLSPFIFLKLWEDRSKIKPFILSVLAIYTPFFIIRPYWVMEWVSMFDDGRVSHNNSASIWQFGISIVIISLVILFFKLDYKGIFLSHNPVIRPYDYVMLIGQTTYLLIPISWFIMWWCNQIQSDWPYFLMGVFFALYNGGLRPLGRATTNDHKRGISDDLKPKISGL